MTPPDDELSLLRDLVPYIVYTFDLRTRTARYLNRHVAVELGYGTDVESLGQDFVMRLLHPDDVARLPDLLGRWEHAPEGAILETEYRMRHADGSWRWFLGRDKALERDAAGKVVRIIGTTLDITARKQLEQRLRHQETLESLGRVAGGVAHDFGNLLMVLAGVVARARSPSTHPDELRDLLRELDEVVSQGRDLTKTLLGAVRSQPPAPTLFDAGEATEALLPLLRRVAEAPVFLRRTPEPAPVRMDRSALHRALLNLVVNARDALGAGGRIEVAVDVVQRSGESAGEPSGSWVAVSVTDDGEGMPPDVLERAFQPYFTTKKEGEGTGLGLPGVLETTERAGGMLRVESAPGRGTKVELRLPRAG